MCVYVYVYVCVCVRVDSKSKDDLALWNWFLVFVGVTLPSLAMTPQSNFISVIEGILMLVGAGHSCCTVM